MGAKGGQRTPCPQRVGAKVPFLCRLLILFFHIFFLHLFSQAQSPFIPRISWLVTKCNNDWGHMFVKSNLKFKFWRHYDVMLSASALFRTSAPPALLLFRRPWINCFYVCLYEKVIVALRSLILKQIVYIITITAILRRSSFNNHIYPMKPGFHITV